MRAALGWVGLLLGACQPALAADHVWLIGGGPSADHSEAQIEQNVIWAREVLTRLPGPRQLHVYFANGRNPEPDVLEWRPAAERPQSLQPWARVFNTYDINGERFRHNRVPALAGGTEADALRAQLQAGLAALRPGDRGLVVFNGHGGYEPKDTSGNTMALWNDTSLNVRDFEALFEQVDPQVPLRFVFTQCYAGGFGRLIYDRLDARRGLVRGARCGFVAEAEDQPAEGCAPGIDVGDYRDYSTYFFAALAGRARDGRRLVVDPDRERDGRVTPYEAHLYALRAAHSTDLPRATSELYLERQLPWYLEWLPMLSSQPRAPDNPYRRLADELGEALGLGGAAGRDARIAAGERDRKRAGRHWLDEQQRLDDRIYTLQSAIQGDVLRRWPAADRPHTQAYRDFMRDQVDVAQSFILHHPNYPQLVALEDRYQAVGAALLENDRSSAQLAKLRHLERLAWLRDRIEAGGDSPARRDYRRLLSCESAPL